MLLNYEINKYKIMALTQNITYSAETVFPGVWGVETDESWLTATFGEGADADKIIVSAEENRTLTSRTGNVMITYNEETCSSITVTQDGETCSCPPNVGVGRVYNLPQAGLPNGTWQKAIDLYVSTSQYYNTDCIQYLSVKKDYSSFPGDIYGNARFYVEYGGITSFSQDASAYIIRISVTNVSSNTAPTSACSAPFKLVYTDPITSESENKCFNFNICSDGDGCFCSSFNITRIPNTGEIPEEGLVSGTAIASWGSEVTCETSYLNSATLNKIEGGVTILVQHLTIDTTNRQIKLTLDIPENTSTSVITYSLIFNYRNDECQGLIFTQQPNCGCLEHVERKTHYIPQSGITGVGQMFQVGDYIVFNDDGSVLGDGCCSSIECEFLSGNSALDVDITTTCENTTERISGTVRNVTHLYFSVGNIPPNETRNARGATYSVKINNKECFRLILVQAGYVPCDCSKIIGEDGMVQAVNDTFGQNGTGDEYVLLASGSTYGCGSLSGSIQGATEMITIKQPFPTTGEGGDTFYFEGKISSSSQYRSAGLIFTYIDRDGTPLTCKEPLTISQGLNICSCPTDIPEISYSYSTNHGATAYGAYEVVLQTSGVTLVKNLDESYCQFIICESDEDWCSGYTKYDGETSTLTTSIRVLENEDNEPRTATLRHTKIRNVISSAYTFTGLTDNVNYSKQWLSDHSSYDECGSIGSITITQDAAPPCDCDNTGISLPYNASLGATSTSVYIDVGYLHNNCGDLALTFVDCETESELHQQPEWIISWDYIPPAIILYVNENYTRQDRQACFKVSINSGTCISNHPCTVVQSRCVCDEILPDLYSSYLISCLGGNSTFRFTIGCTFTSGDCTVNANLEDWVTSFTYSAVSESIMSFSVGVNKNEGSETRRFYIDVVVAYENSVGQTVTACSKTIYITQKACCGCGYKEIFDCIKTNDVYFVYNETGTSRDLIEYYDSTHGCDCDEVNGFDAEIVDGRDWMTIEPGTQNVLYTVKALTENTTSEMRCGEVSIRPIDINGDYIGECEITAYVCQYPNSGQECNCKSIVGDENRTTIAAVTDSDGRILIRKGEEIFIGEINWSDIVFPECLYYDCDNQQDVETTIEEISEGQGKIFKIWAKCSSTTTAEYVTSTLNRYDYNHPETACVFDWPSRELHYIIL